MEKNLKKPEFFDYDKYLSSKPAKEKFPNNKKNTEVNKIINELIDKSLFFEVEILFQLFKKEQYHNKKILLRLSIISNKFMTENQLNFYSFYLDTYFQDKNINIESLIQTDIN